MVKYTHKQFYPTEHTMNQAEQVLLQAIQKSLWNIDITFPEDTDWNAVLKEAEDQAVLGIVIGVAPADVQEEWKSRASYVTAHFVRILHYQEQLYKLLKDNGIPMVILKGTAASIYYPNPSQRSMGDIDFIVPEDCFDQAKELLMQNGYTVNDNPQYQRHIDVSRDGISFEMHRFFSELGIDIESYIVNGIPEAETVTIYHNSFPILPKTANGLVLLAHLAFHLKTGLGFRQIIDWMMFVNQKLDDAFWYQSFRNDAEKTKLDVVAITITKVCQEYFGLTDSITWCNSADDEVCTSLMDSLLSSGNFGKKRGSGRKVENTITNIKRYGLRYLQTAGEFNWQAYHRHKWLKPFAWIYQIGRYAKQGLQTKRNTKLIREDIERGKQKNDLLEKLKLGE